MAFSDIPIRENGEQISYTWFNTIRSAGLGNGAWKKFTVPYTDLQTAGLTKQVNLVSLDAKGIIEAVLIKSSTAFVGTSISSLLFDVGISTDTNRWVDDYDAKAAVSNSNFNWVNVQEVPSFTTTTLVTLNATAVGANLSALSAGSVDIWLKLAALE